MPIQIGAEAHNFSDPTGLLSDCHRRIELFLGALERVATVADRPLTEQTRAALESALLYFREAAPKHTADRRLDLTTAVVTRARNQTADMDQCVQGGSLDAKVR